VELGEAVLEGQGVDTSCDAVAIAATCSIGSGRRESQ
jgi:hypothetical protein